MPWRNGWWVFFSSEHSTSAHGSVFGHSLYGCCLSAFTIQTNTLIMFSPQHALLPQLSSEQEVYRKYRKDSPVVSVLEWYLGDAGSFTIQAACFLFDLGIAGCLELTCTMAIMVWPPHWDFVRVSSTLGDMKIKIERSICPVFRLQTVSQLQCEQQSNRDNTALIVFHNNKSSWSSLKLREVASSQCLGQNQTEVPYLTKIIIIIIIRS